MRGIHLRWSVVALLALVACDAGREESVTAACTSLCKCLESPIPSEQQQCLGECISEFVPDPSISQACLDCIQGHANRCATLIIDCDPVCDPQQPPPPPPVIVDAFVADLEPKEGQ